MWDDRTQTVFKWLKYMINTAILCEKNPQLRALLHKMVDRIRWMPLNKIHLGFVHDLREAVDRVISDGWTNNENIFGGVAGSAADVISHVLWIPRSSIYCTIKVCLTSPDFKKEDTLVYTIGRSGGSDRGGDFKPSSHRVGENSDFASLVGCYDGKRTWSEGFSVFLSNDLTKWPDFCCSHEFWKNDFRATAVFPIRRWISIEVQESGPGATRESKRLMSVPEVFGFLTFDSKEIGFLGDVPETYSFKGKSLKDYESALYSSAFFQAGALLSDTLECMLRPLLCCKEL